MDLIAEIERLYELPASELGGAALALFAEFKELLNQGKARAAEPDGDSWKVNHWVKKGILLGFRLGKIVEMRAGGPFAFYDKDTYPLKRLEAMERNIRLVPGGSAVRDGAYIGRDVVMMPPMYINVGAYVDDGAMIDSHALVGSCAQVGKRVHLSAGSQLGGVLEPVGALPVIIEDEALVGGNCGIYEGTIVKRRAVIGAGTILTGSTPLYDLVKGKIYRRTADSPLIVPEGAVVVPGSRRASGDFAREQGISIYTPVIVKYRDENTDASVALEEALR